jgi:uncharacterized protein (DUF1015 family)
MATIVPFSALRPSPDVAARVAAVPYDVVNREEARALSEGNPLSFLHVSRAEIGLPGVDPYDERVYQTAAANLETLTQAAPLLQDDSPSIYIYRLRMGAHEQTGVAACYLLDEYDRDIIMKHERTRPDKEDDRTRHMIALRAQTGPVFLTYRASAAIHAIADRVTADPPLFDFEAPDDVRHTIWRAHSAIPFIEAFVRVPLLYIADGHHRAASAARARDYFREHQLDASGATDNGVPAYQTFLGVAFPHDQVQILPYNRIVKDLAALTPESLLEAARRHFAVEDGTPAPSHRGEISMYLAGRWYLLRARDVNMTDAIRRLDVSVLQDLLLEPVLGIGDVRTDKRIDFIGGARGPRELERLVDSGRAALAFSMYPVSIDDLMNVAEIGGIMPPKSTWFEPKLRDGLLIHRI